MLLAERIKAISDIPSKERMLDEKKELRKLNDLRRKGSKNPARLAFDKQEKKQNVTESRLHKTELPIKVTWSDGKDPEDYTIAEFKQRCIVLWEPLKECNPPLVIHDSAYRKSGSKSSSKSSSKASNEIQKGEVKKHRKTGRTVIKKVTPNIKRPSNRMQS